MEGRMRILIVEDEMTSRQLLHGMLTPFGQCDTVIDGDEAIDAFRLAHEENKPYDLILMDIMMPKVNGQEALREIRNIEKEKGIRGTQKVKAIMTTALEDQKNVIDAFYKGGAAAYLVKPIDKSKLIGEMKKLGLTA